MKYALAKCFGPDTLEEYFYSRRRSLAKSSAIRYTKDFRPSSGSNIAGTALLLQVMTKPPSLKK